MGQARLTFWMLVAVLASAPSPLGSSAATHTASTTGDAVPVLVIDPGTHSAPIRQIAVDQSEQFMASVSDDKTVRLWDVATGKLLSTLHPPIGHDQVGRLYGVAISSTGRIAAAGTTAGPGGRHRIYFYDLASRSFHKAIDARGGDIKRLQWSSDGQLLAAAYAGSPAVRVFDPEGNLVFEESLGADAWSLTFSSNGVLAVPVYDGTVHLYSIVEKLIKPASVIRVSLTDPRSVHFSPDGELLAVGYQSPVVRQKVQVDVFEVRSRRLAQSFSFLDLPEGNLRSVAWQRDGRALYAAGSGYRGRNTFVIKRIAWPQGATSDLVTAGNSILDLLPLSDGRVLFATAEPSWGVVEGETSRTIVRANSAQFFDAGVLRINKDGAQVSWRMKPDSDVIYFDVAKRRILSGSGEATRGASTSSFGTWVSNWENQFHLKVGVTDIPMQSGEMSRAISILPGRAGVMLATSRTLRKVDANGKELWSTALATEAKSISVTEDAGVVVVASLDGTITWRRVTDGATLLSLFASPDGKWALWTEHGYYDASGGAENLIGWVVNRSGGEQADYFDMSRFREKYYRPDVIDRVLSLLDESKAITAANTERQKLAATASDAVQKRLDSLITPQPVAELLPPVITLTSSASVESTDGKVFVNYRLLKRDAGPIVVSVRMDGRPHDAFENELPIRMDGVAVGRLRITVPERDGVIQIFAKDATTVSAPAIVNVHWKAPQTIVAATPSPPSAPAKVPSPPVVAPSPPAKVPSPPVVAPAAAPAAPVAQAPSTVIEKPTASAEPPTLRAPVESPESKVIAQLQSMASAPSKVTAAPSSKSKEVAQAQPSSAAATAAPPLAVGVASLAPSATTRPAPPVIDKRPTLYLFAVGVGKYANPEFNLPLAAKDATDFVDAFRQQSGRFYKTVEVRLLTNERATRKAIIEGLDWLKQATSAHDVGVLYLAGHGMNDVDSTYYFAGHDAHPDKLSTTGVAENYFRDALAGIKGKTIFFVDTCYAAKSVGNLSQIDLTRMASKLSSAEYGVIVFSGSDGKQESLEAAEWGNGAFTKALVAGVKGAADYRKQGVVTHRGLDYYVGYEVAKLTSGRQTPVTIVPLGVADFALASTTQ